MKLVFLSFFLSLTLFAQEENLDIASYKQVPKFPLEQRCLELSNLARNFTNPAHIAH